jgi:hypothetical protein
VAYWIKTDESLERNRNRDTDKETYNDIDTKESLEMDKGTDGNTDRTKEMVPHSVSKKSLMSRKKQTDKSTEISSVNKEKNR